MADMCQCPYCSGPLMAYSYHDDIPYGKNNERVRVENIPADYCDHCITIFTGDEGGDHIDKAVAKAMGVDISLFKKETK